MLIAIENKQLMKSTEAFLGQQSPREWSCRSKLMGYAQTKCFIFWVWFISFFTLQIMTSEIKQPMHEPTELECLQLKGNAVVDQSLDSTRRMIAMCEEVGLAWKQSWCLLSFSFNEIWFRICLIYDTVGCLGFNGDLSFQLLSS